MTNLSWSNLHALGLWMGGILYILGSPDDNEGRGWAVATKAGIPGVGADLSRSIFPRVDHLGVGAAPIAVDGLRFKNRFRLGGRQVDGNRANKQRFFQYRRYLAHFTALKLPAASGGEFTLRALKLTITLCTIKL
jgi:hypothetical protein